MWFSENGGVFSLPFPTRWPGGAAPPGSCKLLACAFQCVMHCGGASGLGAQHREGAAGCFDLSSHRGAGEVNRYVESLGQVAVAEKLHGVAAALNKTCLAQFVLRYGCAGLKESLELAQVHDGYGRLEAGVVEALLRQTTVKGHLATFEARTDGTAGAGLLTLVALAAGLTQAGALTATEALLAMLCTGVGLKCLKCQHDGKING